MFTETTINNRRIRNRIARSATNDHLGFPDGRVSPAQVREYEELAAGGTGLIFTGHICVDADHRADSFQNLVSDDGFIPGLASLAEAAHGHGAVIYGQISHGGMKGVNPVDFSDFSVEEVEAAAEAFIAGAGRLAAAGFDGVQIHLAHGYLLSQVLDDVTNRRRDEYGGSDENRIRLPRRIVEGIRENCPEDFGIAVKINANNSALVPCLPRLIYYVGELEQAGICAAEVSGYDFSRHPKEENCYYLEAAARLKERVGIPVILAGGMNSRETMEKALAAGVDMVSLSRALIAEPDFPGKLERGETEISRCLRCNRCFSIYRDGCRRCVFQRPEEQLRANFGKCYHSQSARIIRQNRRACT